MYEKDGFDLLAVASSCMYRSSLGESKERLPQGLLLIICKQKSIALAVVIVAG